MMGKWLVYSNMNISESKDQAATLSSLGFFRSYASWARFLLVPRNFQNMPPNTHCFTIYN